MDSQSLNQAELHAQLEKCREENNTKSEFLSSIAHQLRTPLSGNKWAFKMILDGDLGPLTADQRNVLQKSYDANEQLIRLLQEIIRANQNEKWDFQYTFSKVDMRRVMRQIADDFLEEARGNHVSLILQESATNLPLIELDVERFKLVMQNLIENGIKYNKPNGLLTISLEKGEGDYVLIRVTDEGIGIPEDAQDKLFSKFYRAENAKQAKKDGTGLGLFTAKKIIEKHNGNLWFHSKINAGTTFFVTIPFIQI